MRCRICGQPNLRLFYLQGAQNQYKYYKCFNCGLVNLDLDSISIVHNQKKYENVIYGQKDYDKDINSFKSCRFITKYIHPKGDLLDIGCGDGAVLYFARKDGWKVKGLELSQSIANYVNKQLGIEVVVADFMKFNKIDTKYDVICIRHVFEHIPGSVLALQKMSTMLNKKGFIYFEFPNINSLSHRLQRIRNKIGFLKKKYKPDYVPGHCNEFSKGSFTYLIDMVGGFRLIRWETYSTNTLSNFIYNRIHIGTKARAIIQKV